ncbi:hypothetical protein [Dyella choica]|uniref:Uncharacterized protein n=1 Tax=Dyella choica TaxID=1927959 RepID=A0A3S0PR19_9GAMM|nr:hypothetical protein [Dyella choica]RUL78952.1 hypothetical protein EKH80_03900 [Dyella choica]
MSILSFLTLEDLQTADPRDAIKWGNLTVDELGPGGLPRLNHNGVRIYRNGDLTENRRLALQESAERVLADERSQKAPIRDVGMQGHVWMLIHGNLVLSAPEPLLLSGAIEPATLTSEIYDAMLVEVVMNAEDDPAFARHDPDALKQMFARLRKTLQASLMPPTPSSVATDPPVITPGRGTPMERMAAQREAFLDRGWPTATELARLWGSKAENSSRFTSALRRDKKLFGVWSTRHGGTYVHPDFQFVDAHTLSPHAPALLEALETIPGFSDDPNDVKGGDPGRWRRLFWLYEPRKELSERNLAETAAMKQGQSALNAVVAMDGVDETPRTPADVFAEAPEAVIALARKDAADDRSPI